MLRSAQTALWFLAGCGLMVAHPQSTPVNLAPLASASTSFVSGHEKLGALNDGHTPTSSRDRSRGVYGNWPRTGTQWVQYDWAQPVSINRVEVYWFEDGGGLRAPTAARLSYWTGQEFAPIPGASAPGVLANQFNSTAFPAIQTSRIRLEFDSDGSSSSGISEWQVYDSGTTANFAPKVEAGVDRVVVSRGRTYLEGIVQDDGKPGQGLKVQWTQVDGPGRAQFDAAETLSTAARFTGLGNYTLQLTASDGQRASTDTLRVSVVPEPPATHLEPVWPSKYIMSSPFWQPRFKAMIVNWLPHCIGKIDDPKLPIGGIENFVQAANKLAGKPAKHVGAGFANAWVYNTFESMCLALMIDASGDREIEAAQARCRSKVEEWSDKLLGAQEPDGYIQTMHTIEGLPRWRNNNDCEDYNAGYFISAAIAHYLMHEGKDRRMLDAAIRLADCYERNIGPAPKKNYFGWHQELEQTLVRLARLLERTEGPAAGEKYIRLAKFLLDARRDGDEYDQSHVPVTRQYEAVGHAVRAVYGYSGMTDIAMETGDIDYHSAVQSVWDNLVHRKYYITGGIGSGETSEGFGPDFSLPNNSYCESCAGCGQIFFQHKMQLAYQQARHADLFEETIYNNVLGGLDLEGRNFYYPNPLDSDRARYDWHVCPCCVGNIPRTLFMLPSWAYSLGKGSVYVNLFFSSTVEVGAVNGIPLRMKQETDYPWAGRVNLVLEPAAANRFELNIRMPDRQVSQLYSNEPEVSGLKELCVNGRALKVKRRNGYASILRTWKPGDRVTFEVPLQVQRVRSDPRVKANQGRVALRYGPVVYNFESVDQGLDSILDVEKPVVPMWNPDLLGGVVVLHGRSTQDKPMMAVPNYTRLNRGGRSLVWIKDR